MKPRNLKIPKYIGIMNIEIYENSGLPPLSGHKSMMYSYHIGGSLK